MYTRGQEGGNKTPSESDDLHVFANETPQFVDWTVKHSTERPYNSLPPNFRQRRTISPRYYLSVRPESQSTFFTLQLTSTGIRITSFVPELFKSVAIYAFWIRLSHKSFQFEHLARSILVPLQISRHISIPSVINDRSPVTRKMSSSESRPVKRSRK
jgi:hypothetical protein